MSSFFPRMVAAAGLLTGSVALSSGFPGAPDSDPWQHRPNDPSYPEMWQLFSHIPVDHVGVVSDWERAVGPGLSVDRAWQLHTGSPDTVIAVLDSGINWDARDLLDRHVLNLREIPPPAGGQSYDRNGDGRVSVSDYAGDARVTDANGNGVLDAGDLIRVFSDGRDDDGNGYVDDIAGWDFHEHDNDPDDRIRFGHGTGEAKDSVAAINNGIGGAGICGNCSFMAMRVNDSFVVDATSFARAVIYAVDQGADVIQQALGSANHNPFTQYALNYAYERGVVVIGSAADENSYHHNYPSTLDPVVYANAIRYDSREPAGASTFVNFNNCSNYGARVDVAVSGRSCSSEATGNLSGVTGLAVSYARSLGVTLTPGEIISLIKGTTTDIALGSNADDPERHPTWAGWDMMTGYGRVHARRILERIRDRGIPPEARIVSPGWFELYANHRAPVPVAVQVGLPRSGNVKIRLEVARGVETHNADWELLAETPVLQSGFSGELVRIQPEDLGALVPRPSEPAQFEHAYTLRLTVEDLTGNTAEARRTLFWYQDSDLLAGFPVKMRSSGEGGGVMADLDGDGRDEFVTADGGGQLHAYSYTGSELTGFPVGIAVSRYADPAPSHNLVHAAIYAPVAVGDLEGDGRLEIITATLEGHVGIVGPDGSLRKIIELPFPDMGQARRGQAIAQGVMAAPVLADLDLDGALEVIVTAMDGRIYAFRADGSDYPGFPLAVTVSDIGARIISSPAVGDIDGDGFPDLVFGSNHEGESAGFVFAVSGRGNRADSAILSGFPVRIPLVRDAVLPTVGTGIPTAPVLADLDEDGLLEVIVHPFVGKTYILGHDGRIIKSLSAQVSDRHPTDDQYMLAAFGHPAVFDVTGDGRPEIMTTGVGQRMLVSLLLGGRKYDYHHMLGAWDFSTGQMISGFPASVEDMTLGVSPVALDLDNDGRSEIIAGSGGYYIQGYRGDGVSAGFRKFTGGWVFSAVAAGDMDGDGTAEIAATTREGNVFIWKTRAVIRNGCVSQWPAFKGGPMRQGRMQTCAR